MSRPENPMDALKIIIDRVREVIEGQPGLTLNAYSFKPHDDEDPSDYLTVAVQIDPEVAFATPKTAEQVAEEAATKAAFDNILMGDKIAEREQKVNEAREDAIRELGSLRQEDGIGLDD